MNILANVDISSLESILLDDVHGNKEILRSVPYKEYQFEWLVSRSMAREENLIYVFDCNG